MVGVARFELATSASRTQRSNRAEPHPELEGLVSYGILTGDIKFGVGRRVNRHALRACRAVSLTLPLSPPEAGKPVGEGFLFDPPLPPRERGGFIPHWGAAIPGGAAQSAAGLPYTAGAVVREYDIDPVALRR